MNITIDIGNTQVKTGVFEEQKLVHKVNFPHSMLKSQVEALVSEFPIERGIVSHVSRLDKENLKELQRHFQVIVLNRDTRLPFENRYATPETLGVDRMGLAAAAVSKYPGRNVLVIDSGSCITFDFVNANSQYLGGAISPGIEMRFKAVNAYTANLPLLRPEATIPEKADSTDKAIPRGILNGVICEIDCTINQFKAEYPILTVVLTGGDANFLANNLKSSIFATPNFLLEGLNSILRYNS